jgi:hypothetical protein
MLFFLFFLLFRAPTNVGAVGIAFKGGRVPGSGRTARL